MLRVGILLLLLPTFFLMTVNPQDFLVPLNQFQDFSWHGFINESNTLRGQVNAFGIPWLGKLTASHTENAFYKYLDTALTTLDTHFLFFEGDINPNRSTKSFGVIPLVLLPLTILGIQSLNNRNRLLLFFYWLINVFVVGMWKDVYYVTVRLPLIISIILMGLIGLKVVNNNSKVLGGGALLILVFQYLSNWHYLFTHYL